jgi:serine/threonine protein phosphatase PrpC
MTLNSITAALPRNALIWGVVAGITAKATQVAICSFFRASPRLISLMAKASHVPGGSALVNYGPSIVIALATGALLRYCSSSIKPIYESLHARVDQLIQEDAAKEGRSEICVFGGENRIVYTCSNYPKREVEAHTIFCDAFGYADKGLAQVVAIADGCGWGKPSQRAARAMVDNFITAFQTAKFDSPAEQLVMKAALDAQGKIEKNHKEDDLNNFYGETTFLGGMIFKTIDGKRFFAGVNCGDCKLYHLKQGQYIEVTKAARTDATDSGGRFGPHRTLKDKTEYTFSVEVQPGDKLLFMTDGVHDNLDNDPPEKGTNEPLGAADQRKLATLQGLPQDALPGDHIIDFAYKHSEKYLKEMVQRRTMRDASRKEFPGKPDHMTLLVVQVK